MTGAAPRRALRDLHLGPLLGKGGMGTAYLLQGDPDTVFKQFHHPLDSPASDTLEHLIALPDSLDAADRATLLSYAAWPLAAVERDGLTVGFTMNRAPLPMRADASTIGGVEEVPFTLDFLMVPDETLQARFGFTATDRDRIEILREVVAAVESLHRLGVVIRDLAPRNIALRTPDRPPVAGAGVLFLDADSFIVRGESLVAGIDTPGWTVGDLTGEARSPSSATDIIKVAALIVRVLGRDPNLLDPEALDGLAPDSQLVRDLKVLLRGAAYPIVTLDRLSQGLRFALLTPDPEPEPDVIDGDPAGAADALTILMLGTEWLPRRGGLSQVNRRLALEFAAMGHQVVATTLVHDMNEAADAANAGVRLVVPEVIPGHPDLHLPVRLSGVGRRFDAVIGHDRFTGIEAATQARVHHAGAVLVQIVHTIPEEIEWLKDRAGPALARLEQRQGQLVACCEAADVVVAVGPRITRSVQQKLIGSAHDREVIRIDPGIDSQESRPTGRRFPDSMSCLVLGRAEDPELKGLDLAAAAVRVANNGAANPMRLAVRGAEATTGDELHLRLVNEHHLPRADVEVRPYNPAAGTTRRDLLQATVVLMPSRSEGFGLVALEAIEVGTPALVSSRSGCGELMNDLSPEAADLLVVPIEDDWDTDVAVWASKLLDLMANPTRYRDAALAMWDAIAATAGWSGAAQTIVHAIRQGAAAVPFTGA